MGNEEKTNAKEVIKKHFTAIKELCDSSTALLEKRSTEIIVTEAESEGEEPEEKDRDTVIFEMTEKMQDEIEEIRELLFEE